MTRHGKPVSTVKNPSHHPSQTSAPLTSVLQRDHGRPNKLIAQSREFRRFLQRHSISRRKHPPTKQQVPQIHISDPSLYQAAIIYRIDALNTPYMNIFASSWVLLAGSLVVAAPLVFWKVRDTVPVEEDLRFSDESLGDVVAVASVREKV